VGGERRFVGPAKFERSECTRWIEPFCGTRCFQALTKIGLPGWEPWPGKWAVHCALRQNEFPNVGSLPGTARDLAPGPHVKRPLTVRAQWANGMAAVTGSNPLATKKSPQPRRHPHPQPSLGFGQRDRPATSHASKVRNTGIAAPCPVAGFFCSLARRRFAHRGLPCVKPSGPIVARLPGRVWAPKHGAPGGGDQLLFRQSVHVSGIREGPLGLGSSPDISLAEERFSSRDVLSMRCTLLFSARSMEYSYSVLQHRRPCIIGGPVGS
jgi:hypothetical protein